MAGKSTMLAAVIAVAVACAGSAEGADAPKVSAREDRSVAERIGEGVENVAKKIEQGVTAGVKTFEDQRVGERLGETIKNAATKTGEELERVGKKIADKFSK